MTNQVLISTVSTMTFLRQFEWGIVKSTTDAVPVMSSPSEDIKPFASSACSFYTINDLVSQMKRKLPTTKIRIFRVPSAWIYLPNWIASIYVLVCVFLCASTFCVCFSDELLQVLTIWTINMDCTCASPKERPQISTLPCTCWVGDRFRSAASFE